MRRKNRDKAHWAQRPQCEDRTATLHGVVEDHAVAARKSFTTRPVEDLNCCLPCPAATGVAGKPHRQPLLPQWGLGGAFVVLSGRFISRRWDEEWVSSWWVTLCAGQGMSLPCHGPVYLSSTSVLNNANSRTCTYNRDSANKVSNRRSGIRNLSWKMLWQLKNAGEKERKDKRETSAWTQKKLTQNRVEKWIRRVL